MIMEIIKEIRGILSANADPVIRESSKRYFKEEIKVYGTKTSFGQKLSSSYISTIREMEKEKVFSLCEELFSSGYMEESFIACNWAEAIVERLDERDFIVLERWITEYVSNWATCDTLCNHTVGDYLERFPYHIEDLKRWAVSSNRWLRRASVVSLILPARKGLFLEEVFALSDILLTDGDDLVQKGYGWLLKEASKSHQDKVFSYIMERKDRMPRTALRYAIEKMPEGLRKMAMDKKRRP
jgi:3-methyladenine DNA glycosylase AlkD